MTQHEYSIPMDVLSDEAPQELTPEQRANLWQQEISELGQMLPADSGARYAIDGLGRHAETWSADARRASGMEAERARDNVRNNVRKNKTHAHKANAPHARQVTMSDAHAPIEREYPTAAMMNGTLDQSVPRSAFDGLFASPFQRTPRDAAVDRAHQETATVVGGQYAQGIDKLFTDNVDPALDALTQAEPTELAKKIADQLAETTDEALSPELDKLREAVMNRREIGLGSTALRLQGVEADRVVYEAVGQVRQLLMSPRLYSPQLTAARNQVLHDSYGLPTPQELATRVAAIADEARGAMVDRLLEQVGHMVAQYQGGVEWQHMNVSPPEKPEYMQEVDAEIVRMREEGLPDGRIHRRLMMKYHSDSSQGHPEKARYVSDLIAADKPKQGYRN